MDPSLMPGGDGTETPTEAQVTEANDWDSAAKDLFPALHKDDSSTTSTTIETTQAPESTTTTTTVAPDSSTTTTTTVEPSSTTTTTTVDPNETPEQKAEREKKEADDEAARIAAEVEENLPEVDARSARQIARDAARQVEAVAKDVREKMFKDAPTELVDADGDPIRTVTDVMKLINPVTGEGFTQEEAGMWLLSAQQKFNQGLADMDKRITQIAEVNVDLKDQADSVTYRYGELLKADTALRDRVWAEYEKTLVKDPDSGIIIGMPVSLEAFYDTLLAPYAKLAESMENQATEEQRVAAEAAAKEAEEKKKRERADRSDIFGRGNVDDMTDPEDKEWAKAAEVVFGPKKK